VASLKSITLGGILEILEILGNFRISGSGDLRIWNFRIVGIADVRIVTRNAGSLPVILEIAKSSDRKIPNSYILKF
jgi:hypothetical protein